MPLRWSIDRDGDTVAAYTGSIRVGTVIARTDGSVVWQIDAVSMRWIAKGFGETTSIAAGKRALARAWSKWLVRSGLEPRRKD